MSVYENEGMESPGLEKIYFYRYEPQVAVGNGNDSKTERREKGQHRWRICRRKRERLGKVRSERDTVLVVGARGW